MAASPPPPPPSQVVRYYAYKNTYLRMTVLFLICILTKKYLKIKSEETILSYFCLELF